MFTDLVGFTRLGQQDEEAALRLRREHQALLRPVFEAHGGREVKSLGDGFLVEFASAVESVRCAVEIQRALAERNARPGVGDPIVLRIGVHVGEVVEERGDVLGDAVNVASRIEPLAEPGGICVSAIVYEQVRNKLPLAMESLGPRTLKNVAEPMTLYRVQSGAPRPAPRAAPPEDGGIPRLAVLPLANLSADPADEFFADGLTDELISRTAQIPRVRVIARTSVQRYKSSPKSIREVGQELDVGVALEGSIRKAGNRVRITVQLIDTRSEAHLWSTRYDRPLDDIFAIQDDIAGQVATHLAGHFSAARADGSAPDGPRTSETRDLEAYSMFLHARQLLGEKGSEASMRLALSLFEAVVARDPNFGRARVGIAETLLWLATDGVIPYRPAEERAEQELLRALALNDRDAEAHSAYGGLNLGLDRHRLAERSARRAMELNPSLSDPYRWLAQLAIGRGQPDEAIRLLRAAHALNPDDINVIAFLGRMLAYAGRDAEALAFWAATKSRVRYRTNAHLAEFYLSKGDLAAAEECVRELERLRPDSGWTAMFRGILAARQGDRATAEQLIGRLERRAQTGEMTTLFVGFIQYALGEMDAFVASMEESLRLHSLPLVELMYAPLYAGARTDPRIQELIRRQMAFDESPPDEPGPTDGVPGASEPPKG